MMERLFYVGLAGAVGSVLRFLIAGWVQRSSAAFPVGTFAVNVLGCLVMGFLAERLTPEAVHPNLRAAVLVGLLGGFTTFSAFSWETWKLFELGRVGSGLLNVLLNVTCCVLGVWCGVRLARGLLAS